MQSSQQCNMSAKYMLIQVEEETGIRLHDVAFAAAENSIFSNGAHYVTIFMKGTVAEVTFLLF
jgi:hypothetical protein